MLRGDEARLLSSFQASSFLASSLKPYELNELKKLKEFNKRCISISQAR